MKHFLVIFLALYGASQAAQAAEKRVALVIGVAHYQNEPALANPANDARLIAAKLEKLGFQTETVIDPDKDGLREAIHHFVPRLDGAQVALFYYAGHGLQVSGHNYLLGVNAALDRELDLKWEAEDVQDVLDVMDAPNRVNLVFLDACRDNPLSRSLAARMGGRGVLVGQGLARMDTAASGTLIAYSTAPNTEALDGDSGDSPFTTALAHHLADPGVDVEQMLRRVRADVRQATNGQQQPWVSASLDSDFYFIRAEPRVDPPAPVQNPAPGQVAMFSPELVFWQSIEASSNKADFEAYLQKYPNGEFAVLAHNRIQSFAQPSPPAYHPPAPPAESSDTAHALARVAELPPTLLQYALCGVRAYAGPIDGRAVGKAWQNGVRAWQKTSGLAATGSLAPDQIVRLVKEAADRGQAESENTYGIMLASGIGVQRDDSAAVALFERAATTSAQGKYNLAIMLRDGRGVKQDRAEAKRLLQAASSAGYAAAATALAQIDR